MFHPHLEKELDYWAEAGLTATFWWRDDDAVSATAELDRLIHESQNAGVLLAVIPKHADSSLVDEVIKHQHVIVAQHGYAHINHAPRGQGLGAWELGLHRGQQAVMDDLGRGKEILVSLFEEKFIPVVVPPWNRIDDGLYQHLVDAGYCGVSAFGKNRQHSSHQRIDSIKLPLRSHQMEGGSALCRNRKDNFYDL